MVRVAASEKAADSGVGVKAGETYRFSTREDAEWRDWRMVRKADGSGAARWYPGYMRMWSPWLLAPGGTAFALYGRVGEGSPFIIGRGATVCVEQAGTLRLFANDVRGFYWNNYGWIDVTVSRLWSKKP